MRPMRRKDRAVSEAEALEYLKTAEYGVLSTVGPDGEPYGVPLTYALEEGGKGLVFHCSREGYKLECFAVNPRAHFVAVQDTKVLSGSYSIQFKSVMAEGTLEEVVDRDEKIACVTTVALKYGNPDAEAYARQAVDRLKIFRLRIEAVSGKHLVKSGFPGIKKGTASSSGSAK